MQIKTKFQMILLVNLFILPLLLVSINVQAKDTQSIKEFDRQGVEAPTNPPYSSVRFGAVAGNLSYPSEDVPITRICAISIDKPNLYRCVTSKFNQERYIIKNIPPGKYYVIAYPKPPKSWGEGQGFPQAYTHAVICGLKITCKDHSMIAVHVFEGKVTKGIDPADYGRLIEDEPDFPLEPR